MEIKSICKECHGEFERKTKQVKHILCPTCKRMKRMERKIQEGLKKIKM